MRACPYPESSKQVEMIKERMSSRDIAQMNTIELLNLFHG